MSKFTRWILKSIPLGILSAIMWAAQIGPEEAQSNLAKWIQFIGIHDLPTWLFNKAADRWVFLISLLLCAGYLLFLWSPWKKKSTPLSPDSKTTSKGVELKFDPMNHSFLFEDSVTEGQDVVYFKWARVAVRNCLDKPQRIKVEILANMKPCPPEFRGRLPLALHIKDDNNPPYSESKIVAAGDHQFFDVVSYQVRSVLGQGVVEKFILQHAVAGVRQDFEPADYKICLEAIGETSSDPKAFLIGIGRKDGKFYMKQTRL